MSPVNGSKDTALNGKVQMSSEHVPAYRMEDIVTPQFPDDPLQILGEKNFGSPRFVPESEIGTPIQEFFRDASVLITGGTGFMGKTLTEKLLRSCPHLKMIYLLIRIKKGKSVKERLEDIVQDRLFLRLQTEVPHFRSKITVVTGDIAKSDLGLCASDKATLVREVNIVLHGAATVRFDEFVRTAVHTNILGVRAMIQLAREMPSLKSFVHVSTAYSHCIRSEIDEVFYEPPCNYDVFIEKVLQETDDAKLKKMTPELLGKWPNTYTLTKALAEDLVRNEAKDLPVAIFRPSIIVATYQEPVRGWTDNPYGPGGLMVGAGMGVIHVTFYDYDKMLDIVPIDMVINAVLAAVWKAGMSEHRCQQQITIYNFISSAQKPISSQCFEKLTSSYYDSWPFMKSIWTLSIVNTKYKLVYSLLNLFLHYIPGLIMDASLRLRGRQPMLYKLYKKINRAVESLEYFGLREWTWRDNNVRGLWSSLSLQDQELFFFHMGDVNWKRYSKAVAIGIRVYFLKDDIHTLPAARRKAKKQRLIHQALKTSFLALCLWLLLLFVRFILGHFSNRTLILCAAIGLHLFTFVQCNLKSKSSTVCPKSKTD